MAMVLFYNRINWENFPSIVTPVNEINLNKVDYAVKTLDERTVALDTTKAEKSVVLNTIKDWSLDEKTGIITITKVNGDVLKFDLNIEKIPVKFELSEDGILTMTTDDGSKFTADIGSMIPVIEFRGSDTIKVTKYINGTDKTYSFTVKDGSITEEKLQPNYLADIKVQAESAELSATASTESAKESKSYAIGGTGTREGEDTDNAKYYAEKAKENIEPVMNAVSDIALNRQTLGYVRKNLLEITTSGFTLNGITVSVEDDGKVVLNGTATADISISVGKVYSLKANTKYIFSGLSKSTASIYMDNIGGISGWTVPSTKGFTPLKDVSIFGVWLYVKNGATLIDEAFYPMIRSADITDDTYEPYVDDVNTRLKALTPVTNLITTVAGKPLDATMGKELGDRVTKLEDAFINYPVSLINGWTGELVVAINVFNRQATITGYINGTNATDVVFAKGRDYVSQLVSTLCDMPIPVQATAITAIDYATAFYRITFSSVDDGWDVKAPNIGKTYQFNASVIVSKN